MEDMWSRAAEQLPALTLSLGAFLFMIVKGMHFFTNMMATFMEYQKSRDVTFLAGMSEIGDECHRWGERREDAMLMAMKEHKETMARQEDAVRQLTSALERSSRS